MTSELAARANTPFVKKSTIMMRTMGWIRVPAFYLGLVALAGCLRYSANPQAAPPAESYRTQDFDVRTPQITERIKGAAVSDEFFTAGKLRPLLGRTILADEHRSMQVAVISYRFWNDEFHADPASIGRTLQVNGQNVTIVGVMPPDFSVPAGAQLWVPSLVR